MKKITWKSWAVLSAALLLVSVVTYLDQSGSSQLQPPAPPVIQEATKAENVAVYSPETCKSEFLANPWIIDKKPGHLLTCANKRTEELIPVDVSECGGATLQSIDCENSVARYSEGYGCDSGYSGGLRVLDLYTCQTLPGYDANESWSPDKKSFVQYRIYDNDEPEYGFPKETSFDFLDCSDRQIKGCTEIKKELVPGEVQSVEWMDASNFKFKIKGYLDPKSKKPILAKQSLYQGIEKRADLEIICKIESSESVSCTLR